MSTSLPQHPLSVSEVLEEIHELGYINLADWKLILPKFNVHTRERLPHFLRYLKDYSKHSNDQSEFFFTLYDAWFEHANPSEHPIFVPATREILQYYKGHGSAGEPGRFIKPYELKDLFPYFSLPVLAFGKHYNDPHTIQMPDYDFIRFKGYEELKKEIDRDDIEWERKINSLFFRGGIHGFGYCEYDASTQSPRSQRKMLVDLSSSINTGDKWLDAQSSYSTTKKVMLQYKYQIDIDGEVNAWSALEPPKFVSPLVDNTSI